MSATAGYPAEGEEIGPFRVVRRIGAGGMGAVFEAVDLRLDRRVALKVIAPHLAADPEFRRRLTAEARALAALDSPHVVDVYAHGEAAGRLHLVTQLIPDGDLARRLEEVGALPFREGLDLVSQVAAGLADAHAAGVVHRDVKPANVLLRRRDGVWTAYLADFGVACGAGGEPGPGGLGEVGTPLWMAPELWSGRPAGVASDLYALGCLLCAVLTGRPPYTGATEARLVEAHRGQPVPQLVGDSPMVVAVNRILRRAMAKDPEGRYTSAVELREDLRHAATLADRGATATTRRRAGPVAAAVVAVALAGGGVALAGDRESVPAPHSVVTSGDRATAVASLSRALAGRGVMGPAAADCTARRWIDGAGLRAMVAAGFFDADLEYVDRDRSAMTPRIHHAAAVAARACAVAMRRTDRPARR